MRLSALPVLLGSLGLSLSLTACEMPLEGDEDLAADESAIVDPAPRWKNIPLLLPSLEIQVCDEADAGTDDYVTARFQVGTSLRSYTLDNPGNDFERGKTYTYYFPTLGGGWGAQLSDLKAITITKDGRDALCIERVALRTRGIKVWEHTSTEVHDGTYLNLYGDEGKRWLDPTTEGGRGNTVRYTDKEIHYSFFGGNVGNYHLEIRTCDKPDAGTDDTVRVSWSHDGIVEPFQTIDTDDHDDFERGSSQRYYLAFEGVEKLDKIRIEKNGTDGWCIDSIRVWNFYRDWRLLYSESVDKFLDGDGSTWVGVDVAKDEILTQGDNRGLLGRQLSRADYAVDVDEGFQATPIGNHPSCRAPAQLGHTQLEGIFTTAIAAKLRTRSGTWGDDDTVRVTRGDSNSAHVRVHFDVIYGLNMDFNVNFSCADTTPGDGMAIRRVLLEASRPVFTTDLGGPPQLGDSMAAFFRDWDPNDVVAQLTSIQPRVNTTNTCPGISIDSQGDVEFTWPEVTPVNRLCRFDSSQW